ncbi:MAG: hypothetical protein SH807_11210 [Blastochloris sp.]|nr:hypothetical protein [Blastochloris sp.]
MKSLWPRLILYPSLLIIVGIYLWWQKASDPKVEFLNKTAAMIVKANQGEHAKLSDDFSPEAVAYLENATSLSLSQVLMMARRMDSQQLYQYRFIELSVFYPRDYAEILLERSGPQENFTEKEELRRFPVPFVFKNGKWLIAGGFRGDRTFTSPYEN